MANIPYRTVGNIDGAGRAKEDWAKAKPTTHPKRETPSWGWGIQFLGAFGSARSAYSNTKKIAEKPTKKPVQTTKLINYGSGAFFQFENRSPNRGICIQW